MDEIKSLITDFRNVAAIIEESKQKLNTSLKFEHNYLYDIVGKKCIG